MIRGIWHVFGAFSQGLGPKRDGDEITMVEKDAGEREELKNGDLGEIAEARANPYEFMVAEGHRALGNYEEAITACREGLQKNPDSLAGRLLLGRCYVETEKWNEARVELERVAAAIEECFAVYQLLNTVYSIEKNVPKAYEALRKSMFLLSETKTPGKRGAAAPEIGPIHSPRPAFSKPGQETVKTPPEQPKTAGEDKPLPVNIHTDTLADIYIKQGHLEKALRVYEEILAQEAGNVRVREKYEGLQKRIKADRKNAARQRAIQRLQKMLDAAVVQSGSPSGETG